MSEVTVVRARIASGKESQLHAWFEEMHDREAEVVETLQHEGVYTETAFIRSLDEASFLYIYMEAEDLDVANAAGDKEEYEINREHHEVLRETLTGGWERLETIGHFINPSLR